MIRGLSSFKEWFRGYETLSARKVRGEQIDSKAIRKHKNDIIKLFSVLRIDLRIVLPKVVEQDMLAFISANLSDSTSEFLRVAEYYGLKDAVLLHNTRITREI